MPQLPTGETITYPPIPALHVLFSHIITGYSKSLEEILDILEDCITEVITWDLTTETSMESIYFAMENPYCRPAVYSALHLFCYSSSGGNGQTELFNAIKKNLCHLSRERLYKAYDGSTSPSNSYKISLAQHWLIMCAIPQDSLQGGTLTPLLTKCLVAQPVPPFYDAPDPETAPLPLPQGAHPYPELTRAIREAQACVESGADTLYHIIREFLRMGFNCVDTCVLRYEQWYGDAAHTGSFSHDWQYRVASFTVNSTFLQDCTNRLSDAPLHVRHLLAKIQYTDAVQSFMRFLVAQPLAHVAQSACLRFLVYRSVVRAVVDPVVDVDGRIAALVEERFDSVWRVEQESDAADCPGVYCPLGLASEMHNIVWYFDYHGEPYGGGALEAFDSGLESGDDVELEAIGPRNDPLSIASVFTNFADIDIRPICRDHFVNSPSDPCVKLNACQHLYHLECLDEVLNAAYPRVEYVRCPYCRGDLCATRDYRAVRNAEEGEE